MRYTRFILLLLIGLVVACGGTTEPDITETPLPAATATDEATLEAPTEAPTAVPTEAPTEEATATAVPTEEATATIPPTEEATATVEPEATSVPTDTTTIGLELVAEGLNSPVGLVPVPDGSGRLFVVDQMGQIRIISADGQLMDTPFLDIQDRMVALNGDYDERGLLGLAFHPAYGENGRFFVYYSAPLRAEAPQDWEHTSNLSEFTVSADNADVADPTTERIVLQVDEPQGNHNAGQIAFGVDGYLYIPLGDGGGANDNDVGHVDDWYDVNEGGNGQDLAQNLLGSILRIDVTEQGDENQPYAIPADNPFVSQPGAEEIYAIGFRNPYRLSFDMGGDHALYVGDAGQNLWEEVSQVEAGGNYGWNVKEGAHCFSTADPNQSLAECPAEDADGRPLMDPIIEYQNGNVEGGIGAVVIGGNVYRGPTLPQFEGQYIFGDWSRSFTEGDGSIFVAAPADAGLWTMQELTVAGSENGRLNAFLLSFGQDSDGEMYVLTTDTIGPTGDTGKVYKIVPATE